MYRKKKKKKPNQEERKGTAKRERVESSKLKIREREGEQRSVCEFQVKWRRVL